MSYYHGVRTQEISTEIIGTVESTAGLPVVIGTAPIHLVDESNVNGAKLIYTYEEYESAFGVDSDWSAYTLGEFAYSEFYVYGVKPAVFVNVLNPKEHKKAVGAETYKLSEHKVTLPAEAIMSSVVVKSSETYTTAAVLNTDYTLTRVSNGLELEVTNGGNLYSNSEVSISYAEIAPNLVTADDIIAGIQKVKEVYPRYGMTPGLILSPKWSTKAEVASAMSAACRDINGLFNCICITDIDTEVVRDYASANTWKNSNSYTDERMIVCYPKVLNGSKQYHMSTALAGIIGIMDNENGDMPYMSPSNKEMKATGLCLSDGTEIYMSFEEANVLNSQGIATALNFIGGYRSWLERMAVYPANTDPLYFVSVRRMMDFWRNSFILTYWSQVDLPLSRRVVRAIIDSEQVRLNSWTSRGYLLSGQIKYFDDENPVTELIAGKLTVHTYITPPVPCKEIESIVEFDVNAYAELMS